MIRTKNIIGYEDKYLITHNGEVINKLTMRTLKPFKNERGYLMISLSMNGIKKTKKIHRLVAIHFISNDKELPQVNHKDGIKTNNNMNNLEWCDNSYNNKHAFMIGMKNVNVDHLNKKVIHNGIEYKSIKEFCEFLNIDRNEFKRMRNKSEVIVIL